MITILLLAGCSPKETEIVKTSRTCSAKPDGKKIEMKLDAENDVIKSINISYWIPESIIGKDVSKLSKEEMEEAGSSILTQLGVQEQASGIKVDILAEKKDMLIKLGFDLAKADTSVLEIFGITGNPQNVKLSETVIQAENSKTLSFTCE